MPRPPTEQEKQQHFGEYGFQPLLPVPIQQTTQLSEELYQENPPQIHPEKHAIDRQTVEAESLMSGQRQPTDWDPITWTFDGLKSIQMAGPEPGRETIMFFNGSGNVVIAKSDSGLAINSNKSFTLYEGDSCSVDTEGEFWGFAAEGVELMMVRTYYDLDAMALARRRLENNDLKLSTITNNSVSKNQTK
jgi:hypothetical protein